MLPLLGLPFLSPLAVAIVLVIGQIVTLDIGIYLMRQASKEHKQQIADQTRKLAQQAIDSERRHEEAMAALHALIQRTAGGR